MLLGNVVVIVVIQEKKRLGPVLMQVGYMWFWWSGWSLVKQSFSAGAGELNSLTRSREGDDYLEGGSERG